MKILNQTGKSELIKFKHNLPCLLILFQIKKEENC